jgi:hypothetical protein
MDQKRKTKPKKTEIGAKTGPKMGTKSGPYFQDNKAHEKAVSMEAVNVGPFLEARFGARFWGRILTFFWRSLSPFLMNVVMNCAHFFFKGRGLIPMD